MSVAHEEETEAEQPSTSIAFPVLCAILTIGLVIMACGTPVGPFASSSSAAEEAKPALVQIVDHMQSQAVLGVFGGAIGVALLLGLSCFVLSWSYVNFECEVARTAPRSYHRRTTGWQLMHLMVPINGLLVTLVSYAWLRLSEYSPLAQP